MALRNYIEITDITNKLFSRNISSPAEQQTYIDLANEECEDLAILNGVQPIDIDATTHFKLKQYLVNFTLARYAEDRVGYNAKDGAFQGEDIYYDLFNRSMFRMQNLKPELVAVIFNGNTETPENRAVMSTRLWFA